MPIALDLRVTPYSRLGSYLSLEQPSSSGKAPLGDGLYVCNHHGARLNEKYLFRLQLLKGRRKAGMTIDATSQRIRLRGKGKLRVELLLSGDRTLRVRGQGGAGLAVQPVGGWNVVAHPAPEGRWVANIRPARHRYMLGALGGRLEADATWDGTSSQDTVYRFLPDGEGTFDAFLDEFRSTWVAPPRRESFQTCLNQAKADFDAWTQCMPPLAMPSLRKAHQHAAYVDYASTVSPCGLLERPAMLMSKRFMDQIWSWDHCFNAMAMSYNHPEMAWHQLMVMIDRQDEHGCFPDALNDVHEHFNFSKPPVHGWAVAFCRRRNPRYFHRKRLLPLYEALVRWTNWWLVHRVWPGDDLPYYLHGNDSGWDNSTMFDRGVPLMAPDLGALLTMQVDVLGELADRLGKTRQARQWAKQADRLRQALLDQLWLGDRFIAIRRPDGEEVDSDSLVPNIPIALGQTLPRDVRTALVRNLKAFVTKHGLATERPDSGKYEADGYWRGPIWAPSTMLVVDGLWRAGEQGLARRIARRFCRTCAASGFAENFDALTGEGLRDRAYTWTASVFLVFAAEYVR
jgi:glycogen debranching enzyme